MNDVFKPFLKRFVLVFLMIFLFIAKHYKNTLHTLKIVLTVLQQYSLSAKRTKCQFAISKIDYLSHIISCDGVRADPSILDSMLEWPVPKKCEIFDRILWPNWLL